MGTIVSSPMRYFDGDDETEDRISLYHLKETGYEGLEWIYIDQDRHH
jgi:hypothetical protein